MRYADLHLHTNFSDGTFSPEELVKKAKEKGLSCIAITDHDSVDGIDPALKEAQRLGLELIAGVELTAEIGEYAEIHFLGYFIDYQAKWFADKLAMIRQVRKERALQIMAKLRNWGIDLDPQEVIQEVKFGAIGRLHIARMMQKKGFVSSIQEAFTRFISNNGPCYVKKFKLTPTEAIRMIERLKGLAVLAHPYLINNEALILKFARLGLRGIEVYYPEHDQGTTDYFYNLTKKHGLLITGGSDCHGLGKERITIGDVKVPYDLIDVLKKEAAVLQSGKK